MHCVIVVEISTTEDWHNWSIYSTHHSQGSKPVEDSETSLDEMLMAEKKKIQHDLHYVAFFKAHYCYVHIGVLAFPCQFCHVLQCFFETFQWAWAFVSFQVHYRPYFGSWVSNCMGSHSAIVVVRKVMNPGCVTSCHSCKLQVAEQITVGAVSLNCTACSVFLNPNFCRNLRCIVCPQAMVESKIGFTQVGGLEFISFPLRKFLHVVMSSTSSMNFAMVVILWYGMSSSSSTPCLAAINVLSSHWHWNLRFLNWRCIEACVNPSLICGI